jgi:hypothetical protein
MISNPVDTILVVYIMYKDTVMNLLLRNTNV